MPQAESSQINRADQFAHAADDFAASNRTAVIETLPRMAQDRARAEYAFAVEIEPHRQERFPAGPFIDDVPRFEGLPPARLRVIERPAAKQLPVRLIGIAMFPAQRQ